MNGAAPGQGLVSYATTGRETPGVVTVVPDTVPDLGDLWRTRFPEPDRVAEAEACYPAWPHPVKGLRELSAPYQTGPVPRLLISPGVLRIEVADLGRRAATDERARRKQAQARNQAVSDERYRQARVTWAALTALEILDPGVVGTYGWAPFARDRDEQLARMVDQVKLPPVVKLSQRVIAEWSRKSRSRMVRTFAELDYSAIVKSGRLPCFLTLTLPDKWLEVAPSGKEFKRFCAMLRRRWERAWDEPLIGLWKLEFQRRGAPHLHVFTVMPVGMQAGEGRKARDERYRKAVGDGKQLTSWLKVVWADIVDHPDEEERRRHERAGTRVDIAEGLRMTDPKRVCTYFSKHGTFHDKEYQNIVPPAWRERGKGPGRFWGYWGLEKSTVAVELTFGELPQVARTLRRYGRAESRGRGGMIQRDVRRGVAVTTGRRRFRRVKRRVPDRLRSCSGFVCCNDGPRLAEALSRLVEGGSGDLTAIGVPP